MCLTLAFSFFITDSFFLATPTSPLSMLSSVSDSFFRGTDTDANEHAHIDTEQMLVLSGAAHRKGRVQLLSPAHLTGGRGHADFLGRRAAVL